MYLEKQLIPRKIIMGLDPWLLNKNNQQHRWQSLKNEYGQFARNLGAFENADCTNVLNEGLRRKVITLISLPYLEASCEKYRQSKKPENHYFQTTEASLGNVSMKLADGSVVYPAKLENISVKDAEKEVISYANGDPIYSLGFFREFDAHNQKRFETFVEYLQQQGVVIVFVLPPYHPEVYKALVNNKKYSVALETEQYFRNFAQKRNISVVGAYNAAECGVTEIDFLDGMHLRVQGVDKLFGQKPGE